MSEGVGFVNPATHELFCDDTTCATKYYFNKMGLKRWKKEGLPHLEILDGYMKKNPGAFQGKLGTES